MSQEITVTKTEDHYEMQFDSGSAYPVPTNAIGTLDDDLTPEEVGESVTFRGDYGGHKHCKTFDVEKVTDGLGNADEVSNAAEPTPEHVAEVGYHTAAGQAQQIEAQRLFTDGGHGSENDTVQIDIENLSRRDRKISVGYIPAGKQTITAEESDTTETLIEKATGRIERFGVGEFYGVGGDDAFDRADTAHELAEIMVNRWEDEMIEKEQQRMEKQRHKRREELARAFLGQRAAETDERQLLETNTEWCNDPSIECDMDTVRTYILPNGEFETERSHSY